MMPPTQGIQETVIAADGTPTTLTVTSTTTTSHGPGVSPGQSQPMEVSPSVEETRVGTAMQSSHHQSTQDTSPIGAAKHQSAKQSTASQSAQPEVISRDEQPEGQTAKQQKVDKLTRIMLEVIYSSDPTITRAAEVIQQAVTNFAEYASQFSQLSQAQPALAGYAVKCMKVLKSHSIQWA